MGTRKYLTQALFTRVLFGALQGFGAAVEDEERGSGCCPWLRIFLSPPPAPPPAPVFLNTSRSLFMKVEEEEQLPPSPGGCANVGGYSNVSANDQLGDLFAVSAIPLELPPPSDERHLSFKTESEGENHISTDSDV